jgi:hypothetical protein
MGDEVLARHPALVAVVHAGVGERLLDARTVDRRRGVVGVLLDDREQVAEQPALRLGQLAGDRQRRGRRRGADRTVTVAIDRRDGVDRGAVLVDDRRGARRAAAVLRGAVGGGRARPRQPFRGGFALLRNRFPSSYRLA